MPQYDLAARLRAALEHGDEVALAGALNRDVSMVVDSGDKAGGELRGRAQVIRSLRDQLASHPDASCHTAQVNGRPGLTLRRLNGDVVGVLSVDGESAIERLWLCTSPVKLTSWNRRPEPE